MREIIVSLCIGLLLSPVAIAQNIHSKRAKVKYSIPPAFKQTFTTYSIDVGYKGFDMARYSIKSQDIEQVKAIIGSELGLKLVASDADFRIRLVIGADKYGSAIVNEQYMPKSINKGNTYCYVRFQLDMPGTIEVTDKAGNKLLDESLVNYTRQESDPIPGADVMDKAKDGFIKMWQPTLYARTKSQIIAHALAIRTRLARKLKGESSVSDGWFQSFKKAEKHNLQAYDEWADKAIETLKSIAGEGDFEKIKTSLQQPIAFWLAEYNAAATGTDELSTKKKFVCAYNLAYAYSWTGDTENTKKYLDACVAVNLSGAGGAVNYLDQNIKARN